MFVAKNFFTSFLIPCKKIAGNLGVKMEVHRNLSQKQTFGAVKIPCYGNNSQRELRSFVYSLAESKTASRGISRSNQRSNYIMTKRGSIEEHVILNRLSKLGIEAKSVSNKKARRSVDFYENSQKILHSNVNESAFYREYRKLFPNKDINTCLI